MTPADQPYLERMADTVADELDADKGITRIVRTGKGKGRYGSLVNTQRVALQKRANIHGEMIDAGFAPNVADGTLNRAFGRAIEKKRIVNGDTASDTAPAQEIRIKSDGKGAVRLYQNAARSGLRDKRGREADQPAETWIPTGQDDPNGPFYEKDDDWM